VTTEPESTPPAPPPLHARPKKVRVIAFILAPLVVIIFAVISTSLHGKTGDGPGYFQKGDSVAMIGLGVLTGLGILMLARPRIDADLEGVRVRNIFGSYELPWAVVRAVTYGRGAPWVTLSLHDDDVMAVMAIQAADKAYAVKSTRHLRALFAAHQALVKS
jgi:DNA-binding transcriptional LysR family regulator